MLGQAGGLCPVAGWKDFANETGLGGLRSRLTDGAEAIVAVLELSWVTEQDHLRRRSPSRWRVRNRCVSTGAAPDETRRTVEDGDRSIDAVTGQAELASRRG